MQTSNGLADIEILLNGKVLATRAGSLEELVIRHSVSGAKVATAVNGHFVPEARRAGMTLQHGDKVEIVTPRQGG